MVPVLRGAQLACMKPLHQCEHCKNVSVNRHSKSYCAQAVSESFVILEYCDWDTFLATNGPFVVSVRHRRCLCFCVVGWTVEALVDSSIIKVLSDCLLQMKHLLSSETCWITVHRGFYLFIFAEAVFPGFFVFVASEPIESLETTCLQCARVDCF